MFLYLLLLSGVNTVIAFRDKVGVCVLQLLAVQHSISHFSTVQNSRILRAPPRAKHAALLSETVPNKNDRPLLTMMELLTEACECDVHRMQGLLCVIIKRKHVTFTRRWTKSLFSVLNHNLSESWWKRILRENLFSRYVLSSTWQLAKLPWNWREAKILTRNKKSRNKNKTKHERENNKP